METTIFTVDQIDAHGTFLANLGTDLYTPNPEDGITFLELLVRIDAVVGFSRQDGEIMNSGTLYAAADGRMAYRQEQLLAAKTVSIVDAPYYGPETRVDYRKVGDNWFSVEPEVSFAEINDSAALRRPADEVNDNFLEWKLEGGWLVTVAVANAPGKVFVTLSPPDGVQLSIEQFATKNNADAVVAVNMLIVRFEDLLAPMPGEEEEDDYIAAAERAGYSLLLV